MASSTGHNSNSPELECIHYLIEVHDCSIDVLDDVSALEFVMIHLSTVLRSNAFDVIFHDYRPGIGVTMLTSGPRISVHTWPSRCFALVDVLSFSGELDIEALKRSLRMAFKAKGILTRIVHRG